MVVMVSTKGYIKLISIILLSSLLLLAFSYGVNELDTYSYGVFYDVIVIFFLLFIGMVINSYNKNFQFFYSGILIYLAYAFIFKIIYLLYFPNEVKSIRQFGFDSVKISLGDKYIYVVYFVIAFLISMYLVKLKPSKKSKQQVDVRFTWMVYAFVSISLLLKGFMHFYLAMGIPGVESSYSIPLLGGVLTFYVRLALFFIVNTLLFYAFTKSTDSVLKFFSSLSVLIYLIVDLSIGVKFSIIYEMFILTYLSYILFRQGRLRKHHFVVIFSLFLFVITSFKYINYYRFALLHGYSGFAAIDFAVSNNDANNLSFVHEMINRVTGVENYIVTTLFELDSSSFSTSDLLTGEFAKTFTETVTGVSDSINAVGSTQIGAIYVASFGNLMLFLFLSVLVLSVFSFLSISVFNRLQHYLGSEGKTLSEIFSIIMFVYFLFGSGNYTFFIKEFLITYLSLIVFIKLCFKRYLYAEEKS